jgi:acetylornithine deacetylase/succinyl-diaminopimelate desuccinylase family protein
MKYIEKIFDLIDEEELVQITREMVAIPSITHREGRGMVDFLKRWFKDLGVPVRVYPCEGDRANFFADYGKTDGPGRYIFNGHMDTKPVDGMTIDPFGGEIRDGRIYGRGSCDMKGPIASFLCAIKALVRSGKNPRGGITFFSDIEEEFGGVGGYYWAKQEGLFDGFEGMISCEPSELEVQIGNRGCFVTAFETKGRSAHSGLAHNGVNAVQNMCLFINEFLKLPYLRVENTYFGKCTVNFEKIEGGLYLSAVPDRCVSCVDSRLIPETPPELVQTQAEGLMDRLNRELLINVSETEEPETWRPGSAKLKARSISPEHSLVRRLTRAFELGSGEKAVVGGCPAITIAMVLIEMGIPAVIFGPGSIAQAHTEEEFVEIDQLKKATRVYSALIAEM